MKIFQITASYKPAYIYGGPIMSVSVLCEGLAKSGKLKVEGAKLKVERKKCNLEVFTTIANGRNELDVEDRKPRMIDGVSVTYFKRWTKDHSHFSPGLLWRLRNEIGQAQHDNIVIHIHAWWNLVSVLSCLIAKWYKVPVILTPRGMLTAYSQNNRNSFSKKIMHRLIGHRLLRYCYLHVTSEQEKQDVLQVVHPKSVTVIPNLVSLSMGYQLASSKYQVATSEAQKSGQILNLIFLSRIEKKKGLELLFDALSKLDFEFNLTIAGSGEEDYVKSLKLKAKSLRLEDRLTWVGQVGNDEKFSIMAAHDLLVLPSYNENFANVVIESLSMGTPVLVSKNVGLADYVEANELGWVCSLDPKDIAGKIMESYTDFAKIEKINSIAPTKIAKDFNEEVLIDRYLELYEGVLQLRSE